MKRNYFFSGLLGKTAILLICATIMFAMVGCSSSDSSNGSNSDTASSASASTVKEGKTASDKSTGKEVKLSEFSAKSKDGKEVTLGMKKGDVVKLLGEGKEGSFQDMYEYGQLSVTYKNDAVDTIILQRISSDEQSEYTFKGIKLGDKKADVLKTLGEPSKPFSDATADKKKPEYYYKVNGEKGTFVTAQRDMIEDTSKAMYINYTFEFSDDDALKCITALYVDLN